MTQPTRKFGVSDVMLLVAATALGLAGGRVRFIGGKPTGWHFNPVIGSVWIVLGWTIATLIMRLRQPRPSWRRLCRQPGFIASVAVLLAFSLTWLSLLEGLTATLAEGNTGFSVTTLIWGPGNNLTWNARYSVAAAWLILALLGAWRPEPSWIDRLGIALGGYWLAAPAAIQLARAALALLG